MPKEAKMKKRSREILLMLTDYDRNYRIAELADKFKVSQRTIRNDINDINDFLKQQNITKIKFGSNGILLVGEDIKNVSLLEEAHEFYIYRLSKEERKTLISAILIQAEGHITLSEIADMLFVSRATIINDLDGVKRFLKEGNLKVISHSNKGLLLDGKESDKRTFLLRLMAVDSSDNGQSTIVRSFIKGLNMEFSLKEDEKAKLAKLINEQEHVHGRFFTDASFEYLIQYLMLAMQRIKSEKTITEFTGKHGTKYNMAADILKYVSLYWGLEESEGENEFLSNILDSLSYIMKERKDQRIIGLQLVTRKFIENVSRELATDLNRDFDFYENLVNHLESIFKKNFNIVQRDNFLEEVVERHPQVLRVVKKHIGMLEKYIGREISGIEIDYIVIHICAALERQKKKEIDFEVVVVCNGGVGTSQLLLERMKNRFDFHIVDVASAHHLNMKKYDHIDMIISTIPLKDYEGEYILVTPMFSDEDYLRVSRKIEQLQQKQGKYRSRGVLAQKEIGSASDLLKILEPVIPDHQQMKEVTKRVMEFFGEVYEEQEPMLFELLTEENIQLGIDCRDWREAIIESSQPLLEKGYIEQRYVDAMIHNVLENGAYIVISPGFALPHEGYDMGSNKVGMNLIRLERPVIIQDIDGQLAEVTFFCCMSTIDHKKHMKAFFHLVNMLTNREFKEELFQAETSEQTAEIIKKYELRIKN